MTLTQIREIVRQAEDLGTIEWIYFEGGEPFLYYPVLTAGITLAKSRGFRVGLVSNAYWAIDEEDAFEWLKPFAGVVEDLSVSCDLYHADEEVSSQALHALAAANKLEIPASLVAIAQPDEMNEGQVAAGQNSLRYRGRAAEALAGQAQLHSWKRFTSCPYEDLREPSRVHLDSFGHVHICQGIAIGNLFEKPLKQIVRGYEPERHPIIGSIVKGGPAALFEPGQIDERFADACHLCFSARTRLRKNFPETLVPSQMYGIEDA